jgi:hypothetical protein
MISLQKINLKSLLLLLFSYAFLNALGLLSNTAFADNCGSMYDCFNGLLIPAILVVAGLSIVIGAWMFLPTIFHSARALAFKSVSGAATFFSNTQVNVKRPSSNKDTKKEDVPQADIRIEIQMGIINPINYSDKNNVNLIGDATAIEQNVSRSIDIIQNAREKIRKFEKDKEFINWCIQNKQKPKVILSKITNDHIDKLIELIKPYLINEIIKNISLTVDYEKKELNMELELVAILSYIEIAIYAAEMKITSTRVTFTLKIIGNISESIPSTATIKSSDMDTINKGKKIEINDLTINLEFVISEILIGKIKKILDPVIKIGEKHFNIKKLLFYSKIS